MIRAAAAAALAAAMLAGTARAISIPGLGRAESGPHGGQLFRVDIPGSPDTGGRPSIVYLPPQLVPGRRYPVVYLLHGMPGSPSGYAGSLKLATTADDLIASGQVVPFVAVAPAAGGPHYDGEWAGQWESLLVRTVIPWAERTLPVARDARDRVIGGLSAGGFGAVSIALRHPGLFGTIESWSGYFHPIADGPLAGASPAELAAHDPTRLVRASAPALRAQGVRFFVSTGPSHGVVKSVDTVVFARLLHRLGLQRTLYVLPPGTTKDVYLVQLVAGLRYAFAPGPAAGGLR